MKIEQQSEVDKFFEGLPTEDKKPQNIFDDKKVEAESVQDKADTKEEDEDSGPNRRERRRLAKEQAERESNIILAERLRAATEKIEELDKTSRVAKESDVDPRLVRIFGTGEKETELAKLFTGLLSETKEGAREEALREIASLEESSKAEVEKAEETIDTQLEAIEDAYGIDITSNTAQATKARTQFLSLVERLSPKDDEGNITEFADFQTAYELYQDKYADKVDNSRQKEIASRSMTRSSSSASTQRPITPGWDGWKTDLGFN